MTADEREQAARDDVCRARCVVDCALPDESETEADHAEGCGFHAAIDNLIATTTERVRRETQAGLPCYSFPDECRKSEKPERLWCPPCKAREEKADHA